MKKVNTRLQVYDMKGKAVDNIQLDAKLFDGKVNKALLYEAKKMYEANTHRGTGSTKTRSEVKGGGQKPWRQKGTGRARVGSSRNPIWRHGGVTFAPKPRDFGYSLPKKALKQALLSSLNARLVEQMIKPVVKIEMSEAKTKDFKSMLDSLKVDGKALVVVDAMSDAVKLSSRNLKKVNIKEGRSVNARDILVNDYLIIEKEALEKIAERLK
jgi:large subunit ribosomal protein L4